MNTNTPQSLLATVGKVEGEPMTTKYLGEFPIDIAETPFAKYTPSDWALHWIHRYGGIDGEHHKTWVIDQVARILNGSPVSVVEARWDDGNRELRMTVGASSTYAEWVAAQRDGDDGPDTYSWDVGVPP